MEGKIRYVHLHLTPGRRGGVVTAAVIPIADRSGMVRIGWSFCSPDDQWNRKLGNKIATGRLWISEAVDAGRYWEQEGVKIEESVLHIVRHSLGIAPRWLRDVVNQWRESFQ